MCPIKELVDVVGVEAVWHELDLNVRVDVPQDIGKHLDLGLTDRGGERACLAVHGRPIERGPVFDGEVANPKPRQGDGVTAPNAALATDGHLGPAQPFLLFEYRG